LDLGPKANGVFTTIVGGISAKLGGGSIEQGAITAAFGYLYNEMNHGDGVYNDRDDVYVGPGDTEETYYRTKAPPRVAWTGTFIDRDEISVAVNDALPGRIVKLMPDISFVVKKEIGVNEYEFRIALQRYQVTIKSQRQVSRVPMGREEWTNRYVWRPIREDTTQHIRSVFDWCVGSNCISGR
jgi:hypothetical protein